MFYYIDMCEIFSKYVCWQDDQQYYDTHISRGNGIGSLNLPEQGTSILCDLFLNVLGGCLIIWSLVANA